ncbi:MAG TPA: DUF819 family protein [Exilispira sp.]|nr:DUF819 family protein [Exilispira sp.]HQM89298.1 DUF819 family protein [Exilispira sp.]HQQ19029.1 DUF819 family protein [Exilispira sp.]
MHTLISASDTWSLWTFLVVAAFLSIFLEQKYKWASKISGAIIALIFGLLATNLKIVPTESPVWDAVWDYILPLGVTLLLFQADIKRIIKESGRMFGIFNISALGTIIGAFVASLLLGTLIPQVYKPAGMMTGSYIGGGVNFVALSKVFEVDQSIIGSLTVADNLNMAIAFLILLTIPTLGFFKKHYTHPYDDELLNNKKNGVEDAKTQASLYWTRKEISLKDIAASIAAAFLIVFVSVKFTDLIKSIIPSNATGFMFILRLVFGQIYLVIPIITLAIATIFPKSLSSIPGANEIGMFFIYMFYVVIGIPASIVTVVTKAPILLLFCLIIAIINMVFTLGIGKLFKFSVEECVVASNANLGGPSTAAGMCIAKGWTKLIVPSILVGVWGYIIGNYLGTFVGQMVKMIFGG